MFSESEGETSLSHLAWYTRIHIWKRDHPQHLPSPQDYDCSEHLPSYYSEKRCEVSASSSVQMKLTAELTWPIPTHTEDGNL